MKIYKDNFGNTATIEQVEILPYREAPAEEISYRLWITSDYNNSFTYFASIYETIEDAERRLSQLSMGTFKEEPTQNL